MADVDASRIAVNGPDPDYDWRTVARHVLVSRALDRLEEERLVPERKVLYQFSARGHDMAQVLLGSRLTHARDATCGYYRSRPLLLSLGVDVADALGSAMGRSGGYSDGRDIGVVFNFPNPGGTPAPDAAGAWQVLVEYANRGDAKPPTLVHVFEEVHPDRAGAEASARAVAEQWDPPDPWSPQGRQVFREDAGYLTVVQGAMSTFHFSTRVVQPVA